MMRALAATLVSLLAGPAIAQTDPGVDQIPAAPPPAPAASVTRHIYLQTDLTLDASRSGVIVPPPPPAPASAEARLFLDTRVTGAITDAVTYTYSGRLNLQIGNGAGVPARETLRNDLREAYLSGQGGAALFWQVGRVNLKSGVAEGFNPTDYFKTRAVVDPVSADPTVLREDRLGTAMVMGQMIWTRGSLTLALAPKLAADSPPYLAANLPQFAPMFDRTNARARALVKASVQLFDDVSPEVLAYTEAGRGRFGVNLTKGIGQATIVYLEWSGGRRSSLAYEAYRDGADLHLLPAPPPVPVSASQAFANDLSAGVGYTTRIGVHLDLEYEYHQAGFSPADWRAWFGGAASANAQRRGALWFIRGYANDQQEPMGRRSLFLGADWSHALVRDLSLNAFVDVDLGDRSGTGQLAADYYLSPVWTVGGLVDLGFGRARSNFGSLPQDASLLLKLTRYLQ